MGVTEVEQNPSRQPALQIKGLLQDIHNACIPPIADPPCRKRASVALIIRIRPTYPDEAVFEPAKLSQPKCFQDQLDSFFDQPWVKRGDPEVLFIKRASRQGDRWTGHIALPGGKRDLEDLSDKATSLRETREEIGLALNADHCLIVGNLPERVVTTAWGKIPLMVLCSHVYLLLRYDLPPLTLQPTEIDSAHWVSIRVLGSSSLRTVERCDVFERLSLKANWVTRVFLRTFFGQMLFGATQLLPTESIYCNPMSGRLPDPFMWTNRESFPFQRMMGLRILKRSGPGILRPPLLLWGLTYGIVADFLGPLYPKEPSKFWKWPTFSYWDFRFAAWVCSFNFRRRKLKELVWGNDKLTPKKLYNQGEVDAHSFFINTATREGQSRVMSSSIVEILLDGYLDRLRKAIIISVIIRVVFLGILTYLLTGRI